MVEFRDSFSIGLMALNLAWLEPYENREEKMVSRAGLEPATTALKVRCSTN